MEVAAVLAKVGTLETSKDEHPAGCKCPKEDDVIKTDFCDFCRIVEFTNTEGDVVCTISYHEMLRRVQTYPELEARVARTEARLQALITKLNEM